MTILITGSSGFVGTDLSRRLSGVHRLIGLDINPPVYPIDCYIECDLSTNIPELNEHIDVCIHLASSVGGFLHNINNLDIAAINQRIDSNVMSMCIVNGCQHVVFFSSINVFEERQQFEHAPLKYNSTYATSKINSERFFENSCINLMIVRPTNIFGIQQTRMHKNFGESHVIPELLDKISAAQDELVVLGDGTQQRNFVHVSDISRFVIKNLGLDGKYYFNLRSNILITIAQLANELMIFRNKIVPIRYEKCFMEFEKMKIRNFPMSVPERFGWINSITTIQEGLNF